MGSVMWVPTQRLVTARHGCALGGHMDRGDNITQLWQMTHPHLRRCDEAKAELLYSTRFQEAAEVQETEDQAGHHTLKQ